MNEPIPKKPPDPPDPQTIVVNMPSIRENSRLRLLGSFFIESSGCVVRETKKRGQRIFAKVKPLSIGELCGKLPATMNMDGSVRNTAGDVTGVLQHGGEPLKVFKPASADSIAQVLAIRIVWMSGADKAAARQIAQRHGRQVPAMMSESVWVDLVGDESEGWYLLEVNHETLVMHGASFAPWKSLEGDRVREAAAEVERRASILARCKVRFDP